MKIGQINVNLSKLAQNLIERICEIEDWWPLFLLLQGKFSWILRSPRERDEIIWDSSAR